MSAPAEPLCPDCGCPESYQAEHGPCCEEEFERSVAISNALRPVDAADFAIAVVPCAACGHLLQHHAIEGQALGRCMAMATECGCAQFVEAR